MLWGKKFLKNISKNQNLFTNKNLGFKQKDLYMFQTSLTEAEVVFPYKVFSLNFFWKRRLSEIDALIFL